MLLYPVVVVGNFSVVLLHCLQCWNVVIFIGLVGAFSGFCKIAIYI